MARLLFSAFLASFGFVTCLLIHGMFFLDSFQMKQLCRDSIREHGVHSVTVEGLVSELTPQGRKAVPNEVRQELLLRIRKFLAATADPQQDGASNTAATGTSASSGSNAKGKTKGRGD